MFDHQKNNVILHLLNLTLKTTFCYHYCYLVNNWLFYKNKQFKEQDHPVFIFCKKYALLFTPGTKKMSRLRFRICSVAIMIERATNKLSMNRLFSMLEHLVPVTFSIKR